MNVNINIKLYEFVVSVTTTREEYCSNGYELESDTNFITIGERNNIHIYCPNLWVGDFSSPMWLQAMSHEANHAAMMVLHARGIPVSNDNQEAICYLQDYIFYNAIVKLNKANGTPIKKCKLHKVTKDATT